MSTLEARANDAVVYKICPREHWLAALRGGELDPSRDDQRDGYVHLSRGQQVQASLSRHFAGQADLVLLRVHVERLSPGALRWEPSQSGELFPHLYGGLAAAAVGEVFELALDGRGEHQLPEGF